MATKSKAVREFNARREDAQVLFEASQAAGQAWALLTRSRELLDKLGKSEIGRELHPGLVEVSDFTGLGVFGDALDSALASLRDAPWQQLSKGGG